MNTLDALQGKINNASELDFGTIISQAIDLYKKVWLKGFFLILLILVFVFGITSLFNIIGLGQEPYNFNDGFNITEFASMYSSNVFYNIPQTILISCVSIPLIAGFYRLCKQHDLGVKPNDDYFYFFKGEYLGKIVLLGVIYTAIAAVAQFLYMIPYIYVYVPLSYFSVIFAFNPDLSETEIIKASFSLGNKKWLITFGTMFVAGLLGMIGILACGIGVLFTMSIMYLPVYLIYKDVIGFGSDDDVNILVEEE